MTTNDIDARTIAADIMTAAARDVDRIDVWAHIGQAYDLIDAAPSLADTVLDLIAKAGIDLIWPDGMKDTELDAARVENERLTAELEQVRGQHTKLTNLLDQLTMSTDGDPLDDAEEIPVGEIRRVLAESGTALCTESEQLRTENDKLRRLLGRAVDVLTELGWSAEADRLDAEAGTSTREVSG